MQQLIFFLRKYKFFIFFLLLELIAVFLTLNNYSFHKSKLVNSSNLITGSFYQITSNISSYFHLKERNDALVNENTQLRNLLEKIITKKIDSTIDFSIIDSLNFSQKYTYVNAKIIKNDYHKQLNYLTLNKGENNAVKKEMAVINDKGIIGITDVASANYARVQSILNKNSKINARLKNSAYFGTLTWNGKEYNTVQLVDIPRQAIFNIGDTVLTGGKSTIFPEGVLIGTIISTNKGNTATNSINIKLFNDMSNIRDVYIIKNLDKIEIKDLENK